MTARKNLSIKTASTLLLVTLMSPAVILGLFSVLFYFGQDPSKQSLKYPIISTIIAGISLLGVTVANSIILYNRKISRLVNELTKIQGCKTEYSQEDHIEELLCMAIANSRLRNSALGMNQSKTRISNKSELSLTLSSIVGHLHAAFRASSVEISLVDENTGHHHSSMLVGTSFHASVQSILTENNSEVIASPRLLVEEIVFCEKVLGKLRVLLDNEREPLEHDHSLLSFFANQASIAILNCNYTAEMQRMQMFSEENVKAKTGFLANLSHELRGPLALMVNGVELVKDGLCGDINEEQVELLTMVHRNSGYLLDLMNDVLDYAKAECGKTEPKPTSVEVASLLKDMHGVIRVSAESKKQTLKFRFPKNMALEADKRHIRQILINILTNAVKYTPDGGRIEVWATNLRGKVCINIKDNGVGISDENKSKVFAVFERIEEGYSREQLGTGLGMSLTRSLVQLNGGHIDFASRLGEGSHFWVTFKETAVVTEDELEAEIEAPIGSGENVWLMGKEIEEYRLLGKYLQSIDYSCHSADAELPSDKMKETDIIIIDEINGKDFISNISRQALKNKTKVVVLVSDAFQVDIENYLKLGIDRCFVKPFDLKEIALELNRIITQTTESL